MDTAFWMIKGNDAQGSFRLFLNGQFRRAILCPFHTYKPTLLCDDLLELLVAVGIVGILLPEFKRTLKQRLLHLFQEHREPLFQGIQGDNFLGTIVTSHQHHAIVLYIARPDLHAHGHTAHFPLVELPARRIVTQVHFHTNLAFEHLLYARYLFVNSYFIGLFTPDGDNHNLVRGNTRRQDQARLITMHHDDSTDDACAQSPACRRAILSLAIGIQVLDLKDFGKVRAKIVARPRLLRLAIAHHWLHGVGTPRAGKFFAFTLSSLDH